MSCEDWRDPFDPEPNDGALWTLLVRRGADLRQLVKELREHCDLIEREFINEGEQ